MNDSFVASLIFFWNVANSILRMLPKNKIDMYSPNFNPDLRNANTTEVEKNKEHPIATKIIIKQIVLKH